MKLIQNIITYAILGAILGFSEPLPISSRRHLIIFRPIFEKFGLTFPSTNMTFEVLVNTGSIITIMVYYRKDIMRLITSFLTYIFKIEKRKKTLTDFRYCILLIVATIPSAMGVLFNDYIETSFSNVKLSGVHFNLLQYFLCSFIFMVTKENVQQQR